MTMSRRFAIPALALLVLLGGAMAFDRRFVSLVDVRQKPAMAIYIYAPTAFFAILAAIQLFRGRLWPGVAFAVGLMVTGMFHQYVAGMSHGNPGYMFPGGHIVAPIVSGLAYLVCFLAAWAGVRASQRKRRRPGP